jgi:hypothetical protein
MLIVPWSATINLNFLASDSVLITVTGNVTFTTSNRAAARSLTVFLVNGTPGLKHFTVPGWNMLGPTFSLGNGARTYLQLDCTDGTEASVFATYHT